MYNVKDMKIKNGVDLSLLNERAWDACSSIVRVFGEDFPSKRDISKIEGKEWAPVWIKYWTVDRMYKFLKSHGFKVIGTIDGLIGIAWEQSNNSYWFPPVIGDSEVSYLWRITSTVLNTLDMFGNISNETLEQLEYSIMLTKPKFYGS